ncbi:MULTISPECIES: hypothetical protein [unclassified Streptomyces]|uniref:hypothetical protein n=1 Tax=unclassified Streptomyces TaxID=2593676 RepID=UPI0022560B26|nr:hypothetical protein [Streptomyces sp. NBC_00047]MCX5613329.1 hypothetical protein [Streptomyces sp. NBC_00047]
MASIFDFTGSSIRVQDSAGFHAWLEQGLAHGQVRIHGPMDHITGPSIAVKYEDTIVYSRIMSGKYNAKSGRLRGGTATALQIWQPGWLTACPEYLTPVPLGKDLAGRLGGHFFNAGTIVSTDLGRARPWWPGPQSTDDAFRQVYPGVETTAQQLAVLLAYAVAPLSFRAKQKMYSAMASIQTVFEYNDRDTAMRLSGTEAPLQTRSDALALCARHLPDRTVPDCGLDYFADLATRYRA